MSRETKIRAIQKGLGEVAVAKYAGFASSYNKQLLDVLEYRSPRAVAKVFKDLMPPQGSILDLGCGTGLVGQAVQEEQIQASLTGVDISSAMLANVPTGVYAQTLCGDVCQGLPFPDASFQGAVSVGLSEYVIDLNTWFTEVHRLLAPGSPWLFTYVTSGEHAVDKLGDSTLLLCHSTANVREALQSCGFAWEMDLEVSAYFHAGMRVMHNLAVSRRV